MKRMTKEQYLKLKDSFKIGGDFWNTDKIWQVAFEKFPEAKVISYESLGSGLYCNILVDGKAATIYA